MEKNNSSSSSSMCNKIRQVFASNPAVRAIERISSFNKKPKPVTTYSNSPPSPTKNSTIQTKPPLHPHHKAHAETSGAIPIKFDYSPPNLALDGNSERAAKVAAKIEYQPQNVPTQGKTQTKPGPLVTLAHGHHHGEHSEQQGKKPTDINDTFSEFINRAKGKIRTVSNIGRGQNNPAVGAPDHEAHHATNKHENHKDNFSEFIHRAKKKIRTTTIVGKTGSLRRE